MDRRRGRTTRQVHAAITSMSVKARLVGAYNSRERFARSEVILTP